jgi:HEAT repeat protein
MENNNQSPDASDKQEVISPVDDNFLQALEHEVKKLATDSLFLQLQARFGLGNILAADTPLDELLLALKNQEKWEVRVEAARRLGERRTHSEECVASLMLLLEHDPSSDARAAAARAFGNLQETAAEPALLRMQRDSDPHVRIAVVEALGKLGSHLSQSAIETLLDDFDSELDEYVRAAIVSALGQLGKRAPLDVLRIALYDPEWQVREAAALAMGTQQERADIEALKDLLHDSVLSVAEAATSALNRIATETEEKCLPITVSPPSDASGESK